MADSVHTFVLGTRRGQFIAGCLYHFQLSTPRMRSLVGDPPAHWEGHRSRLCVLEAGSSVPCGSVSHWEHPAMNWPRERSIGSCGGLEETAVSASAGNPGQVSEGRWNRRGVRRDSEVGEKAETPPAVGELQERRVRCARRSLSQGEAMGT